MEDSLGVEEDALLCVGGEVPSYVEEEPVLCVKKKTAVLRRKPLYVLKKESASCIGEEPFSCVEMIPTTNEDYLNQFAQISAILPSVIHKISIGN